VPARAPAPAAALPEDKEKEARPAPSGSLSSEQPQGLKGAPPALGAPGAHRRARGGETWRAGLRRLAARGGTHARRNGRGGQQFLCMGTCVACGLGHPCSFSCSGKLLWPMCVCPVHAGQVIITNCRSLEVRYAAALEPNCDGKLSVLECARRLTAQLPFARGAHPSVSRAAFCIGCVENFVVRRLLAQWSGFHGAHAIV
jgi:hypothetical protein